MELKKIIANNLGAYHYEDEQRNWQGKCVGYLINGNILYKGYYKDDKLHGICTLYKKTGEIDYKKYFWNGESIYRKEYFQNVFKELEKCRRKKNL